jgi:hypothetical protein
MKYMKIDMQFKSESCQRHMYTPFSLLWYMPMFDRIICTEYIGTKIVTENPDSLLSIH